MNDECADAIGGALRSGMFVGTGFGLIGFMLGSIVEDIIKASIYHLN